MRNKSLLKKSILSIIFAALTAMFAVGLILSSLGEQSATRGDIEWTEDFSQTPTNSDTWLDNPDYYIASLSELEGSGTSSDPYKIYTAQQLAGLAYYTQNTGTLSNYFLLCDNIDLSAHYWVPIGCYYQYGTTTSRQRRFNGVFDGQGYTISGLYTQKLSDSNAYSYMGLFGYTGGNGYTVIKNVNVVDSYVQGYSYVGGIVGHNDNGGSIINCSFSGVVSGYSYVGGIVGRFYNSDVFINQCDNFGKVYATQIVGGVIGGIYSTPSSYYADIIRCNNYGQVSASSTATASCGGVLGYFWGTVNLEECSNQTAVSAQGNYVGGILGNLYNNSSPQIDISNSYNSGDISGVNYVAGIAGVNHNQVFISHSYNSGTVNGQSYVVGIGASATNCFNIGEIVGNQNGALSYSVNSSSNSYYGGECGPIGAYYGGDDAGRNLLYSESILQDMLDLDWYQNSQVWTELWDFDYSWQIANAQLRFKDILYWDDAADTEFAGQGTADLPYEISSAEELAGLSVLVNSGNGFSGTYFKITKPIDMKGRYFTPIGWQLLTSSTTYPNYYFRGNFDGGNFAISNLLIRGGINSAFSCQGLFGYLNTGSTIENINIENINLTGGLYVGGVVGRNNGAYLQNCTVSGQVKGHSSVGGVAGYSPVSRTITDSENSANIFAKGDDAGGIVGQGRADKCENRGAVARLIADNTDYYGGIVGQGYASNSSNYGNVDGYRYVGGISGGYNGATYTNVHNYGEISGFSQVAGIVGYARGSSSVNNATNHGQITASGNYSGGIAGQGAAAFIVNKASNESEITGQGYVGGIAGAYATVNSSYNTGRINSSASTAYTGGIVGNYAYFISGCYNTALISAGGSYVGGLVGAFTSSGTITMENSYNKGQVATAGTFVGGLAGNATIASISNSYNIGNVSGGANYVGGLAGYSTTGTFTNTFNGGAVQNSANNMGAILGYGNGATIQNSYFGINCSNMAVCGSGTANVSSTAYRDTLESDAKDLTFYQNESLFSSASPWDFVLTWQLVAEENDGYPTLRNQSYWQDQTLDTNFEGMGTEAQPYLISSEEELAGFASNVLAGNSYSGQYFLLTKDLDLSDHYWTAIGNNTNRFSGNFDGNNFAINGVFVLQTSSYQGLFGYAQNGQLKNIRITNSSMQGLSYVGGIAGYSSSSITNCSYEGSINSTSYGGGIVGYSAGIIDGCSSNGTVYNTNQYAGGIAGFSSQDISNSTNHSSVESLVGKNGGILGEGDSDITISNCKNYGTIKGTSSYSNNPRTGGIAGGSGVIIRNCENYGLIDGNGGAYGAGIAVSADIISNCTNYGNVVNAIYASGIAYQAEIEYCTNYAQVEGAGILYSGGVIRNSVNYGQARVGILSDLSTPSSFIENCINFGDVQLAGIVGYISIYSSSTRTQISGCINFGEVANSSYSGGIIGRIYTLSGGYINIDSCFNGGNISGQQYSGGLVGYFEGAAGSGTINITNSGSEGNISGAGLIGAITGNGRSDVFISNCYAISEISQESLVGDDTTVPSNCVYILTVDDGSGSSTTYKKFIGNDFTDFAWLNDSSCPIPKSLAWSGQFQDKPLDYQDQEDWILYKMQQDGFSQIA